MPAPDPRIDIVIVRSPDRGVPHDLTDLVPATPRVCVCDAADLATLLFASAPPRLAIVPRDVPLPALHPSTVSVSVDWADPIGPVHVARLIRATLEETTIPLSDGVYDPEHHRVVRGGEALDLTEMEARLLDYLIRREGEPADTRTLMSALWGLDRSSRSRVVATTVLRLRTKIEADPRAPRHVRFVDGGYVFVPAPGEGLRGA